MKLDKEVVQRRLDLMAAEGVASLFAFQYTALLIGISDIHPESKRRS